MYCSWHAVVPGPAAANLGDRFAWPHSFAADDGMIRLPNRIGGDRANFTAGRLRQAEEGPSGDKGTFGERAIGVHSW